VLNATQVNRYLLRIDAIPSKVSNNRIMSKSIIAVVGGSSDISGDALKDARKLGAEIARTLHAAGANIIIHYRSSAAAAIALAIRAAALAALLLLVVARTREHRPVRPRIAPLARGGLAIMFALALTWLVPVIGLDSRNAERGVLALVAFGVVTVATRRATLLQVLGVVLVENGLALAALELPGSGSSTAIEFGVGLDLLLVALVASVFHERIFAEFGAGDSAHLRSLR